MFIGTSGNLMKTSSKVGIFSPLVFTERPRGANWSSKSFLNGGKSLN